MARDDLNAFDEAIERDDWDDDDDWLDDDGESERCGVLAVYAMVVSIILFIIGAVWLCKKERD